MVTVVIGIHIAICITLCVIVLLQQGKGAEIGAVFGGSSSTVFGSSGAGNLLTKLTWACAVVFFATSIFLAYESTQRITGSIFEGRSLPAQTAPARVKLPLTKPPVPAPASKAAVPAPAAPAAPAVPAAPKK